MDGLTPQLLWGNGVQTVNSIITRIVTPRRPSLGTETQQRCGHITAHVALRDRYPRVN